MSEPITRGPRSAKHLDAGIRDRSCSSIPVTESATKFFMSKVMEDTALEHCAIGQEEEYVMLNLDEVVDKVNIPPNAPYVLSGLDTLNPLLVIDNRLKLVGEYDETIGTCYVFADQDAARVVHEETGPSERNLFSGACIIDYNQPTTKQVRSISSLHKIIRFRLFDDSEVVPGTAV